LTVAYKDKKEIIKKEREKTRAQGTQALLVLEVLLKQHYPDIAINCKVPDWPENKAKALISELQRSQWLFEMCKLQGLKFILKMQTKVFAGEYRTISLTEKRKSDAELANEKAQAQKKQQTLEHVEMLENPEYAAADAAVRRLNALLGRAQFEAANEGQILVATKLETELAEAQNWRARIEQKLKGVI